MAEMMSVIDIKEKEMMIDQLKGMELFAQRYVVE